MTHELKIPFVRSQAYIFTYYLYTHMLWIYSMKAEKFTLGGRFLDLCFSYIFLVIIK